MFNQSEVDIDREERAVAAALACMLHQARARMDAEPGELRGGQVKVLGYVGQAGLQQLLTAVAQAATGLLVHRPELALVIVHEHGIRQSCIEQHAHQIVLGCSRWDGRSHEEKPLLMADRAR